MAIPAWRWRHQKVAAVEPLLKRVAAERLVLLSSGGSDWIAGSGKAEKIKGGYRVTGRKVFTSGAEAGSILMTGAVHEAEDGSRSVIHFGAPMKAAEVRVEQTWRALGMRGTGSNDVVIENLFIPDAGVAFSRKAGEWHPVFHIIATIAFPLIYAVYLGVAESARDIAIDIAKRKPKPDLSLAGRMDTELRAAQLAHRWMLDTVARNTPSAETVNEVMIGRTLIARHAIAAVELAMELAGGASFYRETGLERRFRDIQGARFHPLQSGPQAHYAERHRSRTCNLPSVLTYIEVRSRSRGGDTGRCNRTDDLSAVGDHLQRKLPSMPTKPRPSALERLWWQAMQLDGASWK